MNTAPASATRFEPTPEPTGRQPDAEKVVRWLWIEFEASVLGDAERTHRARVELRLLKHRLGGARYEEAGERHCDELREHRERVREIQTESLRRAQANGDARRPTAPQTPGGPEAGEPADGPVSGLFT